MSIITSVNNTSIDLTNRYSTNIYHKLGNCIKNCFLKKHILNMSDNNQQQKKGAQWVLFVHKTKKCEQNKRQKNSRILILRGSSVVGGVGIVFFPQCTHSESLLNFPGKIPWKILFNVYLRFSQVWIKSPWKYFKLNFLCLCFISKESGSIKGPRRFFNKVTKLN